MPLLERVHTVGRERKKEEEKANRKQHFPVVRIWTHGLCLQNRALKPLGHSSLPLILTFLMNTLVNEWQETGMEYETVWHSSNASLVGKKRH